MDGRINSRPIPAVEHIKAKKSGRKGINADINTETMTRIILCISKV